VLFLAYTGLRWGKMVAPKVGGIDMLRHSNLRRRPFATAVKACQTAELDLPDMSPHELRHIATSLVVSSGANVKAVQRMLGHASAAMTLDVYADLF
jgi:site-specific recombinase XerD